MWNPRGTPRVWLVGELAQHLFLRGLWANSGVQSYLGENELGRDGRDAQEGGTPDKYGQDQSNGIYTGVH